MEADGWVRTGDIGEIDDCGRFRVIDRVKVWPMLILPLIWISLSLQQNIMKLSQGEYVALEKVENVYSRIPIAMQVFVHGSGLKSYLIGVMVPDPVQFAMFASRVLERRIDPTDVKVLKELCTDSRIADVMLADLNKVAAKSLKG